MKRLTEKQRAFAREYLVDLNASQAALRAGYAQASAGRTGCKLLQDPRITELVQEEMRARATRTNINADSVLLELSRLAFSKTTDVINVKKRANGVVYLSVRDTEMLSPEIQACISEIAETSQGFRIKFHDKNRALELLGKHLGLFPTHVELSGPGGGPVELAGHLTDEQLDEIIQHADSTPSEG